MGGLFRTMRCVATFWLGVSYIANAFLKVPLIDDLNVVLMAAVVVLSLMASTGSSRMIGAVLLSLGAVVLVYAHAPLDVWKQALQENAYLIVMFVMIPLLGIPVRHGGYSDSLREVFVRYAHTNTRYYAVVSGMAASIGVLLSIAAVPLTYEVSRASGRSENKKLLSTALSRGFTTCMIWAPTSATIALVVQVTGVDWVAFFPFALACAVVAEAVGVLMADKRPSQAMDEPVGEFDLRKGMELCVFGFLLIALVMAVSRFGGLSIMLVVAMASLVCPVVWMSLGGRFPPYVREFRDEYVKKKLPQVKNQIVLFAGAGLFAQSIGYSHGGDALAGALLQLAGQNVVVLTVVIVGITLAASVVGVHPIVVIAVVGGALSAAECGVTPIYLALVFSISWAMGNALCPASANVIAVADMVGQSPVKVGLRWNGPYVLVATTVLVAVLTFARMVGLF